MRRDNNNTKQQQQRRRRHSRCCVKIRLSMKTILVVAIVFAVHNVLHLNFELLFDNNNSINYEQYQSPSPDDKSKSSSSSPSFSSSSSKKFVILAPSQVTSDILQNYSDFASEYYKKALNEESAELWLYRSVVEQLSYQQAHSPSDADYFVLPGLLHLYYSSSLFITTNNNIESPNKKRRQDHSFVQKYKQLIVNKTKPHLILIPTWNPKVCNVIGLKTLIKQLQEMGVNNLWSVGFERNTKWQGGIGTNRIIPIPYVIRPSFSIINETMTTQETDIMITTTPLFSSSSRRRLTNFVFYAGDKRKNAKGWAGCDREQLIGSLQNETNMYVRIISKNKRLNQSEYNRMMSISDYCLILCGDTPSTRTLTSAIVAGCIPIRVGSRLRGLCDPPCKKGFGWKPTGVDQPHLPFGETINWDMFPEVDEGKFMQSGKRVLHDLFQTYNGNKKARIRSIMDSTRNSWIYGYGDPVKSEDFGGATVSILKSFVEEAVQ